MLFTGSQDKTARSWHTESGLTVSVFRGHSGAVTCMAVHQANLFTGSWDGTVRCWNSEGENAVVTDSTVYRGLEASVTCIWLAGFTRGLPFKGA